MNYFRDTTTLITGATRGIGRALALEFSRAGGNLLLISRNAAELESIRSACLAAGAASVGIRAADARGGDAFRLAVAELAGTRPSVDAAVCNAGIGQYGPVAKSSFSDILAVLETNLVGAIATAHALLPGMMERGSGSIILVSSVLGKKSIPYNAAYCAAKYGMHGFADALRLEAGRHGVHVGVVCPARTRTDFFDRMIRSVPQPRSRKVPTASAERVARAIMSAIRWRRREVIVSTGGKIWSFIGTHFPRTMDAILLRAVPSPGMEDTP